MTVGMQCELMIRGDLREFGCGESLSLSPAVRLEIRGAQAVVLVGGVLQPAVRNAFALLGDRLTHFFR